MIRNHISNIREILAKKIAKNGPYRNIDATCFSRNRKKKIKFFWRSHLRTRPVIPLVTRDSEPRFMLRSVMMQFTTSPVTGPGEQRFFIRHDSERPNSCYALARCKLNSISDDQPGPTRLRWAWQRPWASDSKSAVLWPSDGVNNQPALNLGHSLWLSQQAPGLWPAGGHCSTRIQPARPQAEVSRLRVPELRTLSQ